MADPNEKVAYLRSTSIGALTDECAGAFLAHEQEILAGTLRGSLIGNMAGETVRKAYAECSDIAYSRIYCAPEVVDVELGGHRIINYLLQRLIEAVLHPEAYASRLLLHKVPVQYDTAAPTLYGRIQSVLDHVSAMTDVYALDLFRKLEGSSLPAV